MAIPTQQTISNGAMANDGTGDSLRDAATTINDNFTNLWEGTFNGSEDFPGKQFVIGTVNAPSTRPSLGEVNFSDAELSALTNLRVSWQDQLGSGNYTTPQMDWFTPEDGTPSYYKQDTFSSTVSIYKQDSSRTTGALADYLLIGQYACSASWFDVVNKPPNVAPTGRFPSGYTFLPAPADMWRFQVTSVEMYGEESLTAGETIFIKVDNLW